MIWDELLMFKKQYKLCDQYFIFKRSGNFKNKLPIFFWSVKNITKLYTKIHDYFKSLVRPLVVDRLHESDLPRFFRTFLPIYMNSRWCIFFVASVQPRASKGITKFLLFNLIIAGCNLTFLFSMLSFKDHKADKSHHFLIYVRTW